MKFEEMQLGKKVAPSIIPIAVSAVIFPISIFLWILNYFHPTITDFDIEDNSPTPSRWMVSIAIPILLTVYGIRKKSLSGSGAFCALFVGFFLTVSSYSFMMSLLLFFLSSSKATKYKQNQKRRFEDDFKEGGQRNWIQVICNGGMATELALLYLLDVGFGEMPIDFVKNYRASWLGIGILGAISCANGDTWASEIGSVLQTTTPRLVTTWRRVPTGTNGGVTLGGLGFSALGGLLIGLGYYFVTILCVDRSILERSPPQWPLLLVGLLGGLIGSIVDSILGATLQYSGVDSQGKVRETPAPNVKHISGFCILDNHSVNLLSTIIMGLILPQLGYLIWTKV